MVHNFEIIHCIWECKRVSAILPQQDLLSLYEEKFFKLQFNIFFSFFSFTPIACLKTALFCSILI